MGDRNSFMARFGSVDDINHIISDPLNSRKDSVLDNPFVTEDHIKKLAKDPDHYIRQSVIAHHKTPYHVVQSMIHDKNVNVQSSLARKKDLKKPEIDVLIHTEHPYILKTLASHPNLSPDHVRSILHKTLEPSENGSDFFRDHAKLSVVESLANRKDLHPDDIETLSRHKSPNVRSMVAANSKLNSDQINRFKDDPHWVVKAKFAARDDLPTNILHHLAGDTDPLVSNNAEGSLKLREEGRTHAAL